MYNTHALLHYHFPYFIIVLIMHVKQHQITRSNVHELVTEPGGSENCKGVSVAYLALLGFTYSLLIFRLDTGRRSSLAL